MKPLAHIMILASAGSGKTYALTNRFVELLARGAAPERIVALTFTRKAAGEFFDEILNKLARAASDATAAATLARDIDAPQLGPADFLRMLRAVADSMHRLRLGTLDSFFARIARVFPLELGLAGDFEVLEEHAARRERQRVLRRMFARAGELDTAQQEFIEAFKRATFGAEEKRLAPKLDAFLDAHQERFLEARDAAHWGEHARIWPQGNVWLTARVDRLAAIRALAAWVETTSPGEKQRERWARFLAAAEQWSPGMTPPRELEYVLAKALAQWDALAGGRAVLEFDRAKQTLTAEACAALVEVTRYIVGGELLRRLATTRGIHAVLRAYDAFYHDAVRRAGKLTFGDVQRLLLPGAGAGALSRAPKSTDGPLVAVGETADLFAARESDGGGENGRLFIDYRLDAEIDHWLLDEFQDTSYGQWSVLKNLIDEAIQDPEGARSFFCVGDVKQAIFTWREGDPRLFREIFAQYNTAAPGAVVEEHLDASWRSGPAAIAMVNAVFSQAATIADLFPGAASDTWNAGWREHVSAVPKRNGHSALLLAADERERWQRVVEIVQEIRPLERGLGCAVLVPTNAVATRLVDFLRHEGGIPAVAESDLHVCTDNALGAALLALMQAAAHPGDTLAWEHVQMTPLGAALAAESIETREDATRRLLGQIHADGFERTMETWLRRIEKRLDGADAFSRIRARQFAAAAARFDETGSRDVAEFVQFMERHVVRDPERAAVVRVMTIHKSKGLGFDVVILPDLQGNRIDERREGLAVQKTKERTVEWILDLPPKLFYRADDVLTAHVRAAEAEACYEALSLLYVALTRAKRAMYVVVEPGGKSVSRNYPKLLAETLGSERRDVRIGGLTLPGTWSSGDADWHTTLSAPRPEAPTSRAGLVPLDVPAAGRVKRRDARRPSSESPGRRAAAYLFSLESSLAVTFGAEVHALLAEVIEVSELAGSGGAVAELVRRWRARGAAEAAIAEAEACLKAPALSDVWSPWRGAPGIEVWRERAFEIVLDETWVTGVFDRVVVERDAQGRAEWVTVYDFKTDRVATGAALAEAVRRHAGQLNLYRQVAARFAGVPVDAVTCEVVFTHVQRRMRVAAERK